VSVSHVNLVFGLAYAWVGAGWVANPRVFGSLQFGVPRVILKVNANLLLVCVIYTSLRVKMVIILREENRVRYSAWLGNYFYSIC
jgi:hypothetical protein